MNEQVIQLKSKILDIIMKRCERNSRGKIQIGSLTAYVFYQLGRPDYPQKSFAKLIHAIMTEAGFWIVTYDGKIVWRGLSWLGEVAADWKHPKANDIPKWVNSREMYRVIKEDGSIDKRFLNQAYKKFQSVVVV